MTEHPAFPDVQGNKPGVEFDINEAYKYMVQILGKKERIPVRFNIGEGAAEILMCLKLRYGESQMEDYASLLAWQLALCKEDQDIWGAWREASAHHQRILGLGSRQTLEQRILAWDDGRFGTQPSVRITTSGHIPVFAASPDFERRVDNANGSRVARGLAKGTEGGLLRHFSATNSVTPWESQGIRPSFGKLKETLKHLLDKAKGKKS